ncbi:hypothetical protein AB0B89_20950 [Sphaerisporangium sp. NPDC049002]|uniref:divisome protein SepX/GlpR n=1 Tax=unclassified Sphaerisporangium TaxID=2630420 RepID=UPI0033C0B996
MSSAFLYLGIVLMWLCVLVPMWLRRDRASVEIAELYNEGEESDGDTLADLQVSEVQSGHAALATATADDEITMELGAPESRAGSGAHGSPGAVSRTRPDPDARATPHGPSRPGASSPEISRPAASSRGFSSPGASSPDVSRPGTFSPDVPKRGAFSPDVPKPRTADGGSADEAPGGSSGTETEPDPGVLTGELSDEDLFQEECRRRARVMARRRRWLLWTVLLHLASLVTAAAGVAPWWSVAPSGVLLASYLAVLRVAVAADAERRVEAAKARAERDRRARERERALEEAAQQAEAEILEFRKRVEPFDQYADRTRRAVGD